MDIHNIGWALHNYGGKHSVGMVGVANIWWVFVSMVGNRALHVHDGHYQYVVGINTNIWWVLHIHGWHYQHEYEFIKFASL